MATKRASRSELPYAVERDLGPFVGARDAVDPYDADSEYLAAAYNIFPDGPSGGAWRTRPALTRLNSVALGTASSRVGQAIWQHTALDGTEYTLAFVGGKFYKYDWSTNLFADITPAGVSINNVNRIYAITFNDLLIVHDGANRPWKYNLATNTASYLTDLPYALYGPWAVYYAKLFAIKNTARNMLVWSEELNPDVGFENVLYLNRWTLGQTDQEGLEGIAATNAALYYFRPNSIGTITGAVTDDFQSAGTRDGVSTDVGTRSPASIYTFDDSIWFVDTFLRQYRIAPGDQLQPLWPDAWQTYQGAALTLSQAVITAHVPGLGVLLTALPTEFQRVNNYGTPSYLMAFGVAGSWFGRWAQGAASEVVVGAMGVVKNANKQEQLLVLDNAGFAYLMELPTSTVTTDTVAPILARADLPVVTGDRPTHLVEFDRLSLLTRGPGAIGATAKQAGVACQMLATDNAGYLSPELPFALRENVNLGLDLSARWVRLQVQTRSAEGRFSLHSAHVSARAVSDDPGLG